MADSLYKRLGGKKAVEAAVDIFYDKVMADKKISRFFKNTDMETLRRMQVRFLTYAFGGTTKFSGSSMRNAHAGLTGLKDVHFDAVVGHLALTLEEMGVNKQLIKEAGAVAETVRDDVLGRTATKSSNVSKLKAAESDQYLSAVDGSATAMMMVDRDLVVTYANPATYRLMEDNLSVFEEAYDGFDVDNLVGTCIDVFHASPERQRKLLNDERNLPFQTDIKVGPLTFALNVSAMKDGKGSYIGNCLEWANVSEAREDADDAARIRSAIEGSATSTMMVDRDLTITYVNPATVKMVADNLSVFQEAYEGFDQDNLVGTCIDIFHKDPAHQRRILNDPKNLPWQADIAVGPLKFELNVSAMMDKAGNYIGCTLEWANVTDARRDAYEAARIRSAIEGSATSTMMVDRDLTITYVNPATVKMVADNLSVFQEAYEGFDQDNLVGTCIDIFHKDPAHQRKILNDQKNLPWKADIEVGPLKFQLNVSAMIDEQGNYIGNTLEWADVTNARKDAYEAARIRSAIEGSATSTMMVDRDLTITYVNPATVKMVTENIAVFQEAYKGFDLDNLVGSCIDVFHKDPAHQRNILSDQKNLPWTADIEVGPLKFQLNVSAMIDDEGNYIGNTLEWADVTEARKMADDAARSQSSIDGSATAIMMVDRDLTITYANDSTFKMVNNNIAVFKEAYPGFDPDTLVGTCIDIFHKDPAHQRKILSDPKNLPWNADIQIGSLQFDLNVSAMMDAKGNYIGNTLEWSDVTETRLLASTSARIQSALDGSATSMMMIDRDFLITYTNEATLSMLRDNLQIFKDAYPGFDMNNLIGSCIDVFHANPDHQRRLLADVSNLPHEAEIRVGPLTFQLNVSAMRDDKGEYIGNTLEWSNITAAKAAEDNINQTVEQVDARTNELNQASSSMVELSTEMAKQVAEITLETSNAASGAEELSNSMTSISAAAEQASANINSVAVTTEEMTNSVAEIANNTERAREVTLDAVKNTENASARVDELDSAAKEISQVIEAIVEIAEQTKLLALNATIEAARAGEAGKGFAVVANEVKELAKQTREATADIRVKIENMQASTAGTVSEIGNINRVMNDVNEIVGIIATSVEEQNVATKDIASNISQATTGVKDVTSSVIEAATVSKEIAENINNVNGGVQNISNSSQSLNESIESVSATSDGLTAMVSELKEKKG